MASETSSTAEERVPSLSYKRLPSIEIISVDTPEDILKRLLNGDYDKMIAENIQKWRRKIKKENLIAVINIVLSKSADDRNPTYLCAFILTPEDEIPDSCLKGVLEAYLFISENCWLEEKIYSGLPPVIMEAKKIPEMTWHDTRDLFEEFIDSYNGCIDYIREKKLHKNNSNFPSGLICIQAYQSERFVFL